MSLLACCGLGEAGWFKRGAVSRAGGLRARQSERQVREVALPGETSATLNMFLNYECQLDDDDMSADDHASDMAALGTAVIVPALPMSRTCQARAPRRSARGRLQRRARGPAAAVATAPDSALLAAGVPCGGAGGRRGAPRSRRGRSAILRTRSSSDTLATPYGQSGPRATGRSRSMMRRSKTRSCASA